ncbi:MAG: glycosyltransferase [Halobacteriota archaeon]
MTQISVIIPTKNEEKSIGKCIEKVQKVFNELHIDGEIIVADNSTDNTPEIMSSNLQDTLIKSGKRRLLKQKMSHNYGDCYFCC